MLDVDGAFTAFWSFDPDEPAEVTLAGEKRAFERLIDFIVERHARNPQLHVYHYAPYEPTALKRLMGRHGTREDEVDRLLRGGVLVDLFRAVRQGLRASVESYSIKQHRAAVRLPAREMGLRDAGTSIVEFEAWLQLGDGERPGSDILDAIEAYNRDDVLSTAAPPRLARGAPTARARGAVGPGGAAAGAPLAGCAGAAARGRCARSRSLASS